MTKIDGSKAVDFLPTLVALAAAGVLFFCHVRWMDEPFDSSLGGVTSSQYYGYAAKCFDLFGWTRLRGQPAKFFLPTTTDAFYAYLNHPPAPHIATCHAYRLFGRDETALRIPILLLLLLDFILIAALARTVKMPQPWVAVGAFAALPLVFEYGNMVDAPNFSVTFLLATMIAWFRWRENPTKGRFVAFLGVAFAASLIDWFNYLLAPALLIDLLFDRRGAAVKTTFLRMIGAGMPFVAGLAAFFGWLCFVTGGVAGALEQMKTLGAVPGGKDPFVHRVPIEYFASMKHWFVRGVGLPVLACAGFGLFACALSARRSAEARVRLRLLAMAAVAGYLPSVVFWTRAAIHEFWILTMMPAIALAVGEAFVAVEGMIVRAPGFEGRVPLIAKIAASGAWALLLAFSIDRGIAFKDSFRTTVYVERARSLDRLLDRDDLVLISSEEGHVRYYAQCAVAAPIGHGLANFDAALRSCLPAEQSIDRLLLGIPDVELQSAAWAIDLKPLIVKNGIISWGNMNLSWVELDKKKAFDRVR